MRARGMSIIEVMVGLSVLLFISVAVQKFVTTQTRAREDVLHTRGIRALEEELKKAGSHWDEVYRSITVLDPNHPGEFLFELASCLVGGTKICSNYIKDEKTFRRPEHGFYLFQPQMKTDKFNFADLTQPTFLAGTESQPVFFSVEGKPVFERGSRVVDCYRETKPSRECPIGVFVSGGIMCAPGQNECFKAEGLDLFFTIEDHRMVLKTGTGNPLRREFVVSHRNNTLIRSGIKVRVLRMNGPLQNCAYMKMASNGDVYEFFQLGCSMGATYQPTPSVVESLQREKWNTSHFKRKEHPKPWPFIAEFPKEFEFAARHRCRIKFGIITWVPSVTHRLAPTEKKTLGPCPNKVPSRKDVKTSQPLGERTCGCYVTETKNKSKGKKRKGSQWFAESWYPDKRLATSGSEGKNFQYYQVQEDPPNPNVIITFRDGGGWQPDTEEEQYQGEVVLSVEVPQGLCDVDF